MKKFIKIFCREIQPWFGENILRRSGISFDFFAQLPNEDAQIFSLLGVIAAPDCAEQGAMRDDFAAILEEVHQKSNSLGVR